MNNIFSMPKLPLQQELVQELLKHKDIRVERIVSSGQTTDWLDQVQAEWVVLLTGQATIEYLDTGAVELQAGDYLYLPAHKVHRVAYTSSSPPCVWLCFFWSE